MGYTTKLEWYPDYELEYSVNKDIFCNSMQLHQLILISDFKKINPLNANDNLYIDSRIKDISVSITDDIIRYAQYHEISKNNDGIYSISEPVRASFFAKWILKIKPCIADNFLPDDFEYTSFVCDSSKKEAIKKVQHGDFRIEFCNEVLALILVSSILNITNDAGEVLGYDEIFHKRELSTVFYSLRYRMVHQDTYTPLLYKIFAYHE
ncbi:hypothetical protein [uncultured Gammaproteobacteria bacterium]|nr:hypothetical protein [uncultured Gammaproteobacteria bacterium]